MSTPTQPSYFGDCYNVTYTPTGSGSGSAISIYGIKSIGVNRTFTIIKASNNNQLRVSGWYKSGINDAVTIDAEDMNAFNSLIDVLSGGGTLTFVARAFDHYAIAGNQLPDQLVTITGFVFDAESLSQPMKSIGGYKFSGFITESPSGDGTDPITITTYGSPASSTNN